MEKVYVVTVESGEKWQVVPGMYLVRAKDKAAAKSLVETKLQPKEEAVSDVQVFGVRTKVLCLTGPVVE